MHPAVSTSPDAATSVERGHQRGGRHVSRKRERLPGVSHGRESPFHVFTHDFQAPDSDSIRGTRESARDRGLAPLADQVARAIRTRRFSDALGDTGNHLYFRPSEWPSECEALGDDLVYLLFAIAALPLAIFLGVTLWFAREERRTCPLQSPEPPRDPRSTVRRNAIDRHF